MARGRLGRWVWIVLTSRDPEATGEVAVSGPGDYRAFALALVLVGSRPEFQGPRLQIQPRAITLETSDADQPARAEILEWIKPAGGLADSGGRLWRADARQESSLSRPPHSSTIPARTDRNPRIRELI